MKKIHAFSAALAAVAVLAGCSKIEISSPAAPALEAEEGDCILTFTNTIECDDATKTEFDGNTILWSVGDEAKFLQYIQKETAGTYVLSGFGSSENRQVAEKSNSYSVSVGTTTPVAFPAYYCAAFPFANYNSATFADDNFKLKVKLPASQTPTATSFDKSADILISECVVGESAKVTKFNLNYYRPVAIAKMTVKNLPSSAAISKITFSAKVDGTSVALAGYDQYSTDGTLPDGTGRSSTSTVIALDYSELSLTADSAEGMTAYFTCFPFALAEGDSFKVQVTTTDGIIFSRNVTIPADRSLELSAGKGSVFAVDFQNSSIISSSISASQIASSSRTTTRERLLYYKMTCSSGSDLKYAIVTPDAFKTALDAGTVAELATSTFTSGSTYSVAQGKYIPDSDYVLVAAGTVSDATVFCATPVHTDFIGAYLKASGTNLAYNIYGANLAEVKYTIANLTDLADETANIANCQAYYDTAENIITINSATKTAIEGAGATGKAYYAYSSGSNKITLEDGTTYVMIVSATSTSGETKFFYSTYTYTAS